MADRHLIQPVDSFELYFYAVYDYLAWIARENRAARVAVNWYLARLGRVLRETGPEMLSHTMATLVMFNDFVNSIQIELVTEHCQAEVQFETYTPLTFKSGVAYVIPTWSWYKGLPREIRIKTHPIYKNLPYIVRTRDVEAREELGWHLYRVQMGYPDTTLYFRVKWCGFNEHFQNALLRAIQQRLEGDHLHLEARLNVEILALLTNINPSRNSWGQNARWR